MRNSIFKKTRNIEESYLDFKIKNYLNCYFKEIQRHFNISDKKMRILVYETYKDLKPDGFIKKLLCGTISIKNLKKGIKWK